MTSQLCNRRTRTRSLLVCAIVMTVAAAASRANAVAPTSGELAMAKDWTSENLLSAERNAWEFMYDRGGSFGIMKGWKREQSEKQLDKNRKQTTLIAVDPRTQLEVRLEITQYMDVPAVEWVLRFTNQGTQDTPILQNVLPLSTEFANSRPGAPFRIRHALGSHERTDDFRMIETATYTPAEILTLAPFGGRSSDGCLPFFYLIKEFGGVCIGVGWSGQWQTTFRHAESQGMTVRAGLEYTHFKLHPGESVRTPAILLVFWEGADPERGQNLLRATLLEHFSPRPGGKPVETPVSISAHGAYGFESTTSEKMVSLIDKLAARDAGFDTFWIDTGWFDLIENNWARSVGNPDPDKSRYPQGMKPVSDAAHAHGMKFLLWFEPERVMPDTWLFQNHRDWIIAPSTTLPFELTYMLFDGFHLFDLGNDEARAWLIDKTVAQIKDFGLDVYRLDFNMSPLEYWRADEAADRQGIREMHYVDGFYKFWDALQAAYPDLLIDNCASGGRRIDFETLRRAVPMFRSDMVYRSPLANQCQEYALSQWIPYHGVGTVSVDPYQFRSGLGANFTTAFNPDNDDESWKTLGQWIRAYKSYRSAYLGDYFPLTPYSLDDDAQIAWQFHRDDLGSGLVQAFRREKCDRDTISLVLKGLIPAATYQVTNVDDAFHPTTTRGDELMSRGVTIPLKARPSAALVLYEQVDRPTKRTANRSAADRP